MAGDFESGGGRLNAGEAAQRMDNTAMHAAVVKVRLQGCNGDGIFETSGAVA
jgi:hypothetical protein